MAYVSDHDLLIWLCWLCWQPRSNPIHRHSSVRSRPVWTVVVGIQVVAEVPAAAARTSHPHAHTTTTTHAHAHPAASHEATAETASEAKAAATATSAEAPSKAASEATATAETAGTCCKPVLRAIRYTFLSRPGSVPRGLRVHCRTSRSH